MRQRDLFPGGGEVETFALPDAQLALVRGFLPVDAADELFAQLRTATPWRQETAIMFGRELPAPRLTAWYGDPGASYAYTGIRHHPRPWTPALRELRDGLVEWSGAPFDSALLNYYRDGMDSVGWHSDDERDLGAEPAIASVSLGAARVFQMKHKFRPDLPRLDIELPHGSLLWMAGRCQRCWKHQVPKRRGGGIGPRIDLTFRHVRRG